MKTNKLISWFNKQRLINNLNIKKKNKNKLNKWIFNDKIIFHKSKSFFSIKPFLLKQKNKKWFQPLIIQKEEGILGIIKRKKFNIDYYLLQAKIEPGNINGIQISPTVQATKSNYLRKHGGKRTVFLNFFLKKKRNIKILSNLKLSEQGTRFLEKHNRNILIEIKNINIPKKSNFCWLTKTNLKHLLQKKNILNMDTISVLSSVIKKNKIDNPFENFSKINLKLNKFKKDFQLKRSLIKFTNLEGWKIQDYSIYDLKKKFFSIFFINIKANTREVKTWDQPIISDHFISLNGFLVCKINNTLHYLLNLKFEPGFKSPKYTSTISEKNFLYKNIKKIKYYNFFKKKNYLLNIINSDEGGRFFKNQSKNIICKLKNYNKLNLSKNYTWVSHNQLIKLINQNKITIEARNLFASYNIDKIR